MISLKYYPNFRNRIYVIDGANICYLKLNEKSEPMLDNLIILIRELLKNGISIKKIYVFCDASLKHQIDDDIMYIKFIMRNLIKETPAGVKADEFILSFCINHENSLIISNDLFRDYYNQIPENWICEKRITVMIINKEIYLVPMFNFV